MIAHNGSADAAASGLPFSALLVATCAFSLGILILGSRTITTVGSKISDLTPSRSYATQVGASVAVLGSSFFGLPVSTSHCLIGSMVGAAFAARCCGVSDVNLDVTVLGKIALGWAVTIPLSAIGAVIIFLPLRHLL